MVIVLTGRMASRMTNTQKELPFTIPDKPVDQYKVKFYRLSMSECWVYIREMECVYHTNTPWDVYSPNDKGGADLVDDWMVYANGSAEGRITGWGNILNMYPENIFATREEAIRESIKRFSKYIVKAEKYIQDLKKFRERQEALL